MCPLRRLSVSLCGFMQYLKYKTTLCLHNGQDTLVGLHPSGGGLQSYTSHWSTCDDITRKAGQYLAYMAEVHSVSLRVSLST